MRSKLHTSAEYIFSNAVSVLASLITSENVYITNTPGYLDGAGAQSQRILSLIAFSRKYGFQFVLSPVERVEVQPIDCVLDEAALERNVNELNGWFFKRFNVGKRNEDVYFIHARGPFHLLLLLLKFSARSIFSSKKSELSVGLLDAYFEMNSHPSTWKLLPQMAQGAEDDSGTKFVHIHFRLSNLSEFSDRNLSISYYESVLAAIYQKSRELRFETQEIIHTDFFGEIPSRDFFLNYAVPQSVDYWKNLGLLDSELNLNWDLIMRARKELQAFMTRLHNPQISQETSWVREWEEMASADYLVTSKSSFSLISGVLNKSGEVYVPARWNLKIPGWIAVD